MATGSLATGNLLWLSPEVARDHEGNRVVPREYAVATDNPEVAETYGPAIGSYANGVWVTDKMARRVGQDRCILTVTYARYWPESNAPIRNTGSAGTAPTQTVLVPEVAFDTSAQTEHVIRTMIGQTPYPADVNVNLKDPIKSFGNLIGVEDLDTINGVDRYWPGLTYEVTRQRTSCSDAYIQTLYALTATVNDAPWKIYAAGEALFLGATGRQRTAGHSTRWDVTYRFLGSKNKSVDVTLAGIVGALAIAKGGWEYMWFRTKKQYTKATKTLNVVVVRAVVTRLYESSDFTDLGLGS